MYSHLVLNLIIFLLPTQLGLHFWPSFSRVVGIRVDYLSPTLYLTDIFLLLFLFLNIRRIACFFVAHSKPFLLATVYIILNTTLAISPLNTLFWWLRTLLYVLFAISLKLNHIKIKDVSKPLIYSAILVISVQIFQFIKQSSLNGIFYYFGERHFTSDTPNLARTTFYGRDFIRVPSLFSHPNSLAGYLLISLFLIQNSKSKIQNTIYKILIFLSLLLTFSKSALLALAVYLLFSKNSKSIIIFSIIISLLLVPYTIYHIPYTKTLPHPLSSRLNLITQTHTIIANNPITGVGFGNFIPALAQNLPGSHLTIENLQPVHNTFLLLLSELGFPIFIYLVYLLVPYTMYHIPSNKSLLALICLTGLLDHYWLTLPQNRLLLALIFGIL